MTEFEKIIIPLLDDSIVPSDVSEEAGFIGVYTEDIDNPEPGFIYLVYDDNVRTDVSCERAVRFDRLSGIFKKYIKMVDSKPLFVYKFWLKPELKKLLKGPIQPDINQKMHIIRFWGLEDDISKQCIEQGTFGTKPIVKIPAQDYRASLREILEFAHELGVQCA